MTEEPVTEDRETRPATAADTGARRRADLAVALNAADGLWRSAACRLAEELDRWSGPCQRPSAQLAREVGVPEKALRQAREVLPRAAEMARRERETAGEVGGSVTSRFEPSYPPPLLDLALPPPVLYHRGPLPRGPAVAMVGSRRSDADGEEAAELFARCLAEAGVMVVSGFARGIDTAAHRGALEAEGAPTVAVLGCGLGVDYPRGHGELGDRIVEGGGALVSEWRCGTQPRPWRFPVRNRVIAALAQATLVVQAAPRSGSLITARHAMELGRDVWAVPGRIFDERALGTNTLIRDGAFLALHPRDLLETLYRLGGLCRGGDAQPALPLELPEPPDREEVEEALPPGIPGKLLQALPPGRSRPAEDLAAELGLSVDQVLAGLLELELAGRVRRLPGPEYRRG